MKNYKIQLKTQTPYVLRKAVSYPLAHQQMRNLDVNNYCLFLLKEDEKVFGSQKYAGQLWFIKCKDIKWWINEGHASYFRFNQLVKTFTFDKECKSTVWFNIPLFHKATKDKFKLLHTFSKDDMLIFKELGISQYNTNQKGDFFRDFTQKYDTNKTSRTGNLSEVLVSDYLKTRKKVISSRISQNVYDPTDITLQVA